MHLLDSNILIYASQPGNEFLDVWVKSEEASVSAISIPEVLGFPGLAAEDEAMFEATFARVRVEPVTEAILRHAAALRREHRMKLGDSIIAATARVTGTKLGTRNIDDFRHIAGLEGVDPFAPAREA